MSNRLDQERETKLQPLRMKHAVEEIKKLGYEVTVLGNTTIIFYYKKGKVTFYPYSGWHSGRTIKDGRGLGNLLNQLK